MTEAKTTPAPWEAVIEDQATFKEDDRTETTLELANKEEGITLGYLVTENNNDIEMIKAAPEMLKVLKDNLDLMLSKEMVFALETATNPLRKLVRDQIHETNKLVDRISVMS
jgi:hypothetical protein